MVTRRGRGMVIVPQCPLSLLITVYYALGDVNIAQRGMYWKLDHHCNDVTGGVLSDRFLRDSS